MRERERKLARRKLDLEMKPFRWAAREKQPTDKLLRTVRHALGIPVKEIAARMGVNASQVFQLEKREVVHTATVLSLARMAKTMGCRFIYGIVPEGGKTLEGLAEERLWAEVLGSSEEVKE